MRVFVVPTTQRGEEQKAIELARQKAVDLKTVYLARRYRRISDAYKEGRLDDAAYLRAKKGAEADAASIEKSYFRFAQDIRKLKGYRHTEIISDLTEATLGFLRGKDSFDDSLSIGEAGGYANRQSRDAIQAAWNRNMGQHGMILYAINPKEGGLFSYTLSPDKIQEKILHGKMPPADIVSPRPQETGGRIADFVITRKIEHIPTKAEGSAPVAASMNEPRKIKEVKLKLNEERIQYGEYRLKDLFKVSHPLPSAQAANKIVTGSPLDEETLKQALQFNGMEDQIERIMSITPTKESAHGTTAKNMRMNEFSKTLFGISHNELGRRISNEWKDIGTQTAKFIWGEMGLTVAGQASDNFDPQFMIGYGADLGNGFAGAVAAMNTPISVVGAYGKRIKIGSYHPSWLFALGFETEADGYKIAAMCLTVLKPDKAFTLSTFDNKGALAQVYFRNGITTGNRAAAGVGALNFDLGKVWPVRGGEVGLKVSGTTFTTPELQKDDKTYRESLEIALQHGVGAEAHYKGRVMGASIGFEGLSYKNVGTLKTHYTISQTDNAALGLFADYVVENWKDSGWLQSIKAGVELKTRNFGATIGTGPFFVDPNTFAKGGMLRDQSQTPELVNASVSWRF